MAVSPESSLTAPPRALGLQNRPSARGLVEQIPLLDSGPREEVGELLERDLRRRLDEISAALDGDDRDAAITAVDLLNSSSRKVGAHRLGFLGIRLSTALRARDPGAARAVYELLGPTADLTLKALEASQ